MLCATFSNGLEVLEVILKQEYSNIKLMKKSGAVENSSSFDSCMLIFKLTPFL